jgi:hypothetical protein
LGLEEWSVISMKKPWFGRALAVVVVAGAAAALMTVPKHEGVRSKPVSLDCSPDVCPPAIAIHSDDGMTFRPVGTAAPTFVVSAADAWAQYATMNGSDQTIIPSSVDVYQGFLTMPVGAGAPGLFEALNRPVWAYVSDSCYVPTMEDAPPDTICREWLFLDATTGEMIVGTWQT